MRGVFFTLVALIGFGTQISRAEPAKGHPVCGVPPEFQSKSEDSERIAGDLKGKAEALSRLVGTAELGGQVTVERRNIYKSSDTGEAARKDAYLQFIFCVIIMDDRRLPTSEKLKALDEFRKPLSQISVSNSALAFLAKSVKDSRRRAQEAAEKARQYAAEYPARQVQYTLRRVGEIEVTIAKKNFGEPVNVSNGERYWGELTDDKPHGLGWLCCSNGSYRGEFSNGTVTGYGRYVFSDGVEVVANFSNSVPSGFGCSSGGVIYGWTFCGQYKDGNLTGPVLRQTYSDDGMLMEQSIGNSEEAGYLIITFLSGSKDIPPLSRYEGEQKSVTRSEYGIAHYPDGTKYEGQWLQDEPQGFGAKSAANGRVFSAGYWQNGLIQGAIEVSLMEESD